MVKLFLFFSLLILSACTSGFNTKEDGKLIVESVIFESNGSFSGDISGNETEAVCKEFVLSEDEGKNFFLQSRVATEREYTHDLLPSNCFSGGTLTTSQGRLATWKIDRARRGYLIFADGDVQYLYCADCTETIYFEACDIGCTHE